MSLFGNLPAPSAEPEALNRSSAPAAADRQLLPPPSILRKQKRKLDERAAEETSSKQQPVPAPITYGLFAAFGDITDEYDPAVPNEYEQAKAAQDQAVLEAELEARRAAEERQAAKASEANDAGPCSTPNEQQGRPGGMSVAMQLMRNMGWSEGAGLGKEGQGISTPIIMQKTDMRTGVIVNAPPQQPAAAAHQSMMNFGTPSKVVLLRNMVRAGEVDDGLEDEVAEEVSKFGDVVRVLIFEVERGMVPSDQAVRIFVEMETVADTTKAIQALAGRYFDNKMISATFFDEGRFHRMDLAPAPDELYAAN